MELKNVMNAILQETFPPNSSLFFTRGPLTLCSARFLFGSYSAQFENILYY